MDDGGSPTTGMKKLSNRLMKLFGVDTDDVTEEEIISMVNEGHEQGVLQANEAEMIHNIFEFGDKDAKDIMVHRKNIIAIDGTMTFLEMLDFTIENNYSRYPVYIDDIDNIIGVLHIKEVLALCQKQEIYHTAIKDIKGLIREVDFIPETRNINTLFTMMQNAKTHMVIVVDEYGQTSGLVAMEDILEEIVGEIHDEYDEKEDDMFRQISEQEYIIEGSMNLDDINDRLETDLVSEDYDSLGGFIIEHLDRLPEVGDEVCTDNGIRLIVEALDKNRVESVRMYLPEKHDADNKSELSSSESAAQTAFTEEK